MRMASSIQIYFSPYSWRRIVARTLWAVVMALLLVSVYGFSYFNAAKIKIDISGINHTEAINILIRLAPNLSYKQGFNDTSDAINDDGSSLSTYFLLYDNKNVHREKIEITASVNRKNSELLIYYRELSSKKFSQFGIEHYQYLVQALENHYGKERIIAEDISNK